MRSIYALVATALLASCSTGSQTAFEFQGEQPVARLASTAVDAILAEILEPGEFVDHIQIITTEGLAEELAEVVTNQRGFYIRPSGEVVPSHLLPELERDAYQTRFGKLTPSLYAQAQPLADSDQLHVVIMVTGDFLVPDFGAPAPDAVVSADEFTEAVGYQRMLQAERIKSAKEPIVGLLGGDALLGEELEYLPFVEADVSAAILRSEALNTSDHVVTVMAFDEGGPASLLGYAGHSSMKIPSLVGGTCGPAPQGPPASSCGGAGLPVGLWEHDDASNVDSAINTRNTRLNQGALGDLYYRTPTTCTGDNGCPDTVELGGSISNKRKCINGRCVEEHMTYTAGSLGMIGSFTYGLDCDANTPDSFGNSGLWNVRYRVGNDNGVNGLNYILSQSVVYVNRSVTWSTPALRAAEFSGQYYGIFLTSAAGNDGLGVDVKCGKLQNGICVGGYSYYTYSNLSTHLWWSFSNDRNNTSFPERPHVLGPATYTNSLNGLALPEIAADGTNTMRYGDYNTNINPCGYQGYPIQGTSFSSPAVLATAVLSQEYEGVFSLLAWSQVTKAVVLSGSVDSNADGALGLSNTSWSATADAKDGAGHPNMEIIKSTLDANRYFGRDMANSDFVSCGASCREYVVASGVTIPLNKSAKVALTWSACSTSPTTDAHLTNDLDLVVTRTCNGTPTTLTSNTISSETEMVYGGCGAQTGSMTIRIRIKNGASLAACGTRTTERVGVAWTFQ